MIRISMLAAVMFLLAIGSAYGAIDDVPKANQESEAQAPEAEQDAHQQPSEEEMREIKENLESFRAGRANIVSVFGEDALPEMHLTVLPEGKYAFGWELVEVGPEEGEDGEKLRVVKVMIGTDRLRNKPQFCYDLAHIVMATTTDPALPKKLIVREPLAFVATVGGARVRQFGLTLKNRGGPLTLKELEAFYTEPQAEPATDEEKAARAKLGVEVQATMYLIGFDLHRRGIIRRFYAGEISAEKLEEEMDPAGAWERHEDVLLPKPPPRRPRFFPLPGEQVQTVIV